MAGRKLGARSFKALSDESLSQEAGATIFKRGQAYWRDGAVQLNHDEGQRAHFEAQGTQRYEVWLELDRYGLDGDCSCPHSRDGFFCKHMVAAALVWRHALSGEPMPSAAEPEPLPLRLAKAAQTRAAHSQALRGFLAQQPAEQLAARLWQRALLDRELMADIKGWAATASVAAGDPKALRQALGTLLKARGGDDLSHAALRGWNARAEQAVLLLRQALPQQAAEVRSLCESALEAACRVRHRAEEPADADAVIGALIDLLAEALQAAPPPATWGERLLERLQGDDGGIWPAARLLAAAGPDAARGYRKHLTVLWARVQDARRSGPRSTSSANDDAVWLRHRARRWMTDDLGRDGDVQAQFEFMKHSAADAMEHAHLIQWCQTHGRERQALQLAQAARRRFPGDERLEDLLLSAYERDGWDDEALAIRRARFERMPAPDLYRPLVAAARRAKADLAALRRGAHGVAEAHEQQALARAAESIRRTPFLYPRGTQAARDVSGRIGLHLHDGEIDLALALAQAPHTAQPAVLEELARQVPRARNDEAFALLKRCFEHEMLRASSPYTEVLRLVAAGLARLPAARQRRWLGELRATYKAKRNFVGALP